MSSLAVRFGRIPKREKQRLLDEMQSYMNSLNESAAMEMDSSVRDSTTSADDCNSKEAIGTISRAYRDIFTGSDSHERSSNRNSISTSSSSKNNNNNTSTFSQDGSFQPSSHPSSTQSYQSCPVSHATICPVASNDNQPAFHKVDNNHYSYLVSTNQNHNQSNAAMGQRVSFTNHNSFPTGEVAQNQPSCPWKLAPGAKVLVRVRIKQI